MNNQTLGGFSPPLTFSAGKAHSVPYFFEVTVKGGKWLSPNNGAPVPAPGYGAS
jgi:hypothetical protein